MKTIEQLIGGRRDEDGVLHVLESARGCPYCGTVEVKAFTKNGETKAAFYHAGAECCARRTADQVQWREAELDQLDKELRERYTRIDQLREQAEHAVTKTEAARLAAIVEKSERGMEAVVEAFKERGKDLRDELTRLRKRHAWLRRQEAA